MALILNIETSSSICSVALAENGKLIAEEESSEPNSHASQLTLFINEVMKKTKISLQNLDAVAVSSGPGSFTGLRIGVSAAKGLCYALEKPLIVVDTLHSLSFSALQKNGKDDYLLCPLIDARRMEIYTAMYDCELNSIEKPNAVIIDENFRKAVLQKNKILFFGNALEKVKKVIINENAVFVENIPFSAKNILKLSLEKFIRQEFENIAYFEPFYLKPFISNNSVN